MLNVIWVALVLSSILIGIMNGTTSAVVAAITSSAQQAVTIAIGLIGIMALWLGIMRVAENAGLVKIMGKLLNPIMKRLFPEVPSDHPAMGAMTFNIAANMLGLGNAATPFGLRAMEQLNKLNSGSGVATHSMCMFLALNTSSLQLIPATAIAILAANGDMHATSIIFPTIIATTCSTITAIIVVKIFQRFSFKKKEAYEFSVSE